MKVFVVFRLKVALFIQRNMVKSLAHRHKIWSVSELRQGFKIQSSGAITSSGTSVTEEATETVTGVFSNHSCVSVERF